MHARTFAAVILFGAVVSALPAASRHLDIDRSTSTVGFRVRATGHSFPGTVRDWTVDITVPEGSEVPDAAEFNAEAASLSTKHEKRDGEMLHWLDSVHFPKLTFHLDSLSKSGSGYTAAGVLELHGVPVPITFPVTIARQGERMTIHGEVVVDHRKFDLPVIKKFAFLAVNPEVAVAFDVAGTLQ